MEWLADLFGGGGLGTIFSGISGLIGGYLTKRENRLTMIEQNKHELAMADVDARASEFELKASIALAKQKLEIAETEGAIERDLIETRSMAETERLAGEAFKVGMAEAFKPSGYPWVDQLRSATRPIMTWLLYLIVVVIFIVLHLRVGNLVAENSDLMMKLYVYLVQSIIYLFIMSVSWWFMSRGESSVTAISKMMGK
jgi:hypothetical protein